MPNPSSKRGFRQLLDGIGNVVPQPRNIGETQVENLGVVLLCELEYGLGISHENSLPASNSASDIRRAVADSPAGGQAATIGRVGQTEESKASCRRWQFDCSYSRDNATLY